MKLLETLLFDSLLALYFYREWLFYISQLDGVPSNQVMDRQNGGYADAWAVKF